MRHFLVSWKRSDEAKRRQRLARNKRKRLEIRQIKKNAHEELVQEKKKRQTTEEKLSSACQKKSREVQQQCSQTERKKERLLHWQMKNNA